MTTCVLPAMATHIVGGELTYKCLGGNRYLVSLIVYRDCIGGIAGAIAEDNPALISVFTTEGSIVYRDSLLSSNVNGQVIPPDFRNDCVSNPPRTCLNRIAFQRTFILDNSTTGYKIVYQRCCRNASIINIVDPSSAGVTYSCFIPRAATATCNNSAEFKNYPPQIICVNNPLIYDHSATDPDGDSLSYEFCRAYDGGSNNNPRPIPEFSGSPLIYRAPYTFSNPMSGSPQVRIDPRTGVISGIPNIQGRYVVAVCCHEWRDGVIINTVTREFQFVVTNCSKNVIAYIPQYSSDYNTYVVNCKDYTINFVNESKGGTYYHWDFGVPGRDDDTSDLFSPTFVYPDSGTYLVTLYVNRGTTCSDSISRYVKVYPKLFSLFDVPSVICPGDTVDFIDQSLSTYAITNWYWNFDDNSPVDTRQNTSHVFPNPGLYNVGLITLNEQGCVDTLFKKILVDPARPNVGRDTSIVKGESVAFQGSAHGTYVWTPPDYLDNPYIPNPIGTYPDTGVFVYYIKTVTEIGCTAYDTITVKVYDNGSLAVPNAFTPNGDGKNDRFRPILVGYQEVRFFRIYNRYGEEVFSTNNIEDAWDGTYKGEPQVMGVYYWMLGVKDRYGNDSMIKGDVTLIR